MENKTKKIVTGALVAALYIALTFMSNALGVAYGPVQFRLSEALCILPVFTPSAIYGLCVGCFVSNIASFNLLDMVFGTFATFLAAFIGYILRNRKIFSLPLLSAVVPIIINALVIGAELAWLTNPAGGFWSCFIVYCAYVALGETVTAGVLGLLLYTAIIKNKKVFSYITESGGKSE